MGRVIGNLMGRFVPLLLFPYLLSGVDFNLNRIISDANRTDRAIFLFLHKDNCRFCERAIFDLEKEDISKIVEDRFIFVDINRDDNETILFQDYNGTTEGFLKKLGVELYPTLIFLNGDGEFIYRVVGYRNIDKFKNILKYIYTKSYREVTFEEFEDELQTNKR